jgi:hypothetical protein
MGFPPGLAHRGAVLAFSLQPSAFGLSHPPVREPNRCNLEALKPEAPKIPLYVVPVPAIQFLSEKYCLLGR